MNKKISNNNLKHYNWELRVLDFLFFNPVRAEKVFKYNKRANKRL